MEEITGVVSSSFWVSIIDFIKEKPWAGILFLFWVSTFLLALKRGVSYWEIWFNGHTPHSFLRKEYRLKKEEYDEFSEYMKNRQKEHFKNFKERKKEKKDE